MSLEEAEYRILDTLTGHVVTKERHKQTKGTLDLYRFADGVIIIFEIEFSSVAGASRYTPPAFAGREISGDPALTGYALARSMDP